MTAEKTAARIDGECRALGRYLFGREVNEYMLAKYRSGCAQLGLDDAAGRFDSLLVAMAVRHPLLAKAGDAYARFLAPRGTLRKKMVLLLAIAEVSPPTFRYIDAADGGGRFMLFVHTMGRGMGMVLCLLPALVVLLPLQLGLKMIGPGRRPGGSRV